MRMTKPLLKTNSAISLLALVLCLAGCGKSPTITVNNTPNQCGGTLHVSGSGFTASGQVQISASGTPGLSGTQKISVATADSSGNIAVDIPFNYPGPGVLPGCAQGSTSTANVTIGAADLKTGSVTFTTIALPNCGMAWGVCPA